MTKTTNEFIEKLHAKNPECTQKMLRKVAQDTLDLIDQLTEQDEKLLIFRRLYKLRTRPERSAFIPYLKKVGIIPEVKSIVYRKRIQ